MAYTDIDKPSDYFETKLYTGNGGTQSITGLDFQPDWVVIKRRNAASGSQNMDSVRGATKKLAWNESSAEESPGNILTSFDSGGFSVGNSAAVNGSSDTFVSWNWVAGTSFTNDASATGIGSIDSTGSVNQDAGFSIVSYTGNSPTATTIKHGLNSVPQMIIFKRRVGAGNWSTFHQATGNTKALSLNTTAAPDTSAGYFNNTTPTSSVFSVANSGDTNSNGNAMIAYCFADVKGYSKFGSYVGNGNVDGTFLYTGFAPAFFMLKRTDSTNSWRMWDNKRDPFNVRDTSINANESDAEYTDASVYMDFVSNGVKFRTTGDNVSGGTYIFMCFAENPFVTSTGVPATAR